MDFTKEERKLPPEVTAEAIAKRQARKQKKPNKEG